MRTVFYLSVMPIKYIFDMLVFIICDARLKARIGHSYEGNQMAFINRKIANLPKELLSRLYVRC